MQKLIIFALVLSFMVFSLPQWASADQSASPDKRMASEYISEGMYEDFEKNAEAVSASAEIAEPEVPASSAVLAEVSTGRILYSKNADESRSPASITKIMTLLLVMESIDSGSLSLTDKVTASPHACSMGGSQIWLEPGETMTVDELLKAVAVASANDAAVALGEHIAGSEEAFVSMMNARAKELSMTGTHFENACGLDTDGHVSTATDVAKMSCELLKHDLIKNYSCIWMDYLRDGKTQLVNTNKLVRFYEGATGLKTGTTDKAGYCVAASAEKNGMELVAVILDGETSDKRFSGAKTLLNYGFSRWEVATKQIDATAIQDVTVTHGAKESVEVNFTSEVSFLVSKGRGQDIAVKITLPQDVEAPVAAGQLLGKVSFTLDDEVIGESQLLAASAVEKLTLGGALAKLLRSVFSI